MQSLSVNRLEESIIHASFEIAVNDHRPEGKQESPLSTYEFAKQVTMSLLGTHYQKYEEGEEWNIYLEQDGKRDESGVLGEFLMPDLANLSTFGYSPVGVRQGRALLREQLGEVAMFAEVVWKSAE